MKKISILILSLAFLAASCSPAAAPSSTALSAWIDAPLDGSTIPLAAYQIVAHSSDPSQITKIEISVDGEILDLIENPNPADLLLPAQVDWTPPSPGTYTIQARGQNGGGTWSSYAQSRVTVEEENQPLPTLELLPTATPELELSICEPEITAVTRATCRQGPTLFNEPLAYFSEGETAPIQGGNQDLSWWLVLPESQTEPCWISDQTVETRCLPEHPEIFNAPPFITRVFPTPEEFYWGDYSPRIATIQAQSGGEIPVTSLRLIYHLAGKADWHSTGMTRTEGEIWQAEIDAHIFKNYRDVSSALVEYYLEAENEAGLVTKTPIYNNLKLKKGP
ncbi:MAG: Ig-like domain-containing protein [Anaerolineales bacterium]